MSDLCIPRPAKRLRSETASSGCYKPLVSGPETIRLLRVLPNEDDKAPLQGQLFVYPLDLSSPRAHLYEALSYV